MRIQLFDSSLFFSTPLKGKQIINTASLIKPKSAPQKFVAILSSMKTCLSQKNSEIWP